MRLKLILCVLVLALISQGQEDPLVWSPRWDQDSNIARDIKLTAGCIRGTSGGWPDENYYEILVDGDGRQIVSVERPVPQYLSGDPWNPETWNQRGIELYEVGKFEESIYYFKEAASISAHGPCPGRSVPIDVIFWRNLELAYRAAGRLNEADNVVVDGNLRGHHSLYLDSYIKSLPRIAAQGTIKYTEPSPQEKAVLWVERGGDLSDRGEFESAIWAFDIALELDPENTDAWRGKAAVLNMLGR